MTVNDFLNILGQHERVLLGYFMLLPLLSFILSVGYKPKAKTDVIAVLFSIIIYLSFLPGVFAGVLVFYTLLILKQNLLNVSLMLYFLPIVSMGLVSWVIGRVTSFDRLPGFGRLLGLMIMLFLVCFGVFFLYHMRFVVGFFGSIEFLVGAGVGLFALFKWCAWKMKGGAS